jgi:hypothetical protein
MHSAAQRHDVPYRHTMVRPMRTSPASPSSPRSLTAMTAQAAHAQQLIASKPLRSHEWGPSEEIVPLIGQDTWN